MSRNLRIRPYSGFKEGTVEHLLLDAGVFFKNFTVGTDTYASAKAAGKCIGATNGGGEFSVTKTYRNGEFDGVKSRVKGNVFVDGIETKIKATLAEITEDVVKMALASTTVDTTAATGYDKIEGRDYILDSDYIENITWLGTLLGSDKPVIIQVYNALSENGLTMAVADKGQAKIELEFYGYNDDDIYDDGEDYKAPFAIFYPQEETNSSTPQEETTNSSTN